MRDPAYTWEVDLVLEPVACGVGGRDGAQDHSQLARLRDLLPVGAHEQDGADADEYGTQCSQYRDEASEKAPDGKRLGGDVVVGEYGLALLRGDYPFTAPLPDIRAQPVLSVSCSLRLDCVVAGHQLRLPFRTTPRLTQRYRRAAVAAEKGTVVPTWTW